MIYVKQETEANFTALHVIPPDFGGLVKAIENKYKINGRCIRDLFKQSVRGHKVKMDDDMISHYSNEAAFLMQVIKKNWHLDILKIVKLNFLFLKIFYVNQGYWR